MEDPFPDLHELFRLYSDIYFSHPPGALDGCFVEWSSRRMTMCCADPCRPPRLCTRVLACCAVLRVGTAPVRGKPCRGALTRLHSVLVLAKVWGHLPVPRPPWRMRH